MRKHAKTYGQILAGSVVVAIGVQLFLAPNQLVIGGASGIAIIVNHLTGWPTGVLIFAINLPIFLVALRQLGFAFLLTALAGVFTTSVLIDAFAFFELVFTRDLLLVAIFGGLLIGVGIALIFSAGSSTGGVDLLARLVMQKRPDMTLGRLLFLFDGTIIVAGALVFQQLDMALYAVISVYVLKRAVDGMLHRGESK